jgi:hypothetical protein
VAGEGEEDLVQAGLAQRQLGHRDLGVGQVLQRRRWQPGVADLAVTAPAATSGAAPDRSVTTLATTGTSAARTG